MAEAKRKPPDAAEGLDDWAQYRRLVLRELERLDGCLVLMVDKEDHAELKAEVAACRLGAQTAERHLKREHGDLRERVLIIETNAKNAGRLSGLLWGVISSLVVGLLLFLISRL